MNDVEALWRAVEASPDDDTLKLALSDALRENGDSDAASVVKWCVDNRRWPVHHFSYYDRDWWEWQSGTTNALPKNRTAVLPPPYFKLQQQVRKTTATGGARQQLEKLTTVFVQLRDRGPKWS